MNVVSPTSTSQQLLQDHSDLPTHDDRLRQMYDQFPRHNASLGTTELAKLRESKDWNDIVRVPAWLENLSRPVSPQKPPELGTPSAYSRSSYKAGPSFTLPPISEANETPFTPQRHVTWPDQPAVSSYNDWATPSSSIHRSTVAEPLLTPFRKTGESSNILLGIAAPQPISSLQGGIQGTYKGNVIPPPSTYFSKSSVGDSWIPDKRSVSDWKKPLVPSQEPPDRSSFPWWSSVSTGGRNADPEQPRDIRESERREDQEEHSNTEGNQTTVRNTAPQSSDDGESVDDAFSSRSWGNWYNRRGAPRPPPGPPDGGRGGGGGRPSPPPPPPPGGNWGPPPGPYGPPNGPPGPPGGGNYGPIAGAPYGNFIPTIKAELKKDDLPTWDGDHETAIEYFWKIQQLASLGGFIPQALGYWLWTSLKEGSTVQLWFSMLSSQEQEYMRSNYLTYLYGLKEGFLGSTWQRKMHAIYENQSFRQQGHKEETPVRFIMRRTMYTRMLVNSDNGGPIEVYLVMQQAPLSWGPAINVDNIRSISQLHSKVTEHEKTLLHVSKVESSRIITADNLLYNLRRLGIANADNNTGRPSYRRRVNLGERGAEAELGPVETEAANDSLE
jgi:hypothetical protein